MVLYGVLGEFFAEMPQTVSRWASFFAGVSSKASCGWQVVSLQCSSHRGTRCDWCCGCLGDVAKVGRKLLQTQTCEDEADDAASNDLHTEAPGAVAPGAPGNN